MAMCLPCCGWRDARNMVISTPGPSSQGVGEAQSPTTAAHQARAASQLEQLQGQLTQLVQAVEELKKENDALRIPGGAGAGSRLRAGRTGTAAAAEVLGGSAVGPSDDGRVSLPGALGPPQGSNEATLTTRPSGGAGKRTTKNAELSVLTAAFARLETQVTELGVRMQRTEGAINGMQAMKEAWETQRAAEEFARQIRKLEEVGIPTHSRRGSNLPSGTSTAAMSFSDDLPTLEGLPQMRYPRQSGQPSLTSRHSSSRRTNNDGLATGSSGGGGRNGPLRSSRQAAASGGGASAGGAAGSGAPGGGGAPPVRGSSVPMLPILEAPGSTDSQASTLAALPPPTLGASPLGIVKQDSCRVTQGPSAVAENTVRMSSDLSRLLPPETAKMVWAEKPCAARTPLRA